MNISNVKQASAASDQTSNETLVSIIIPVKQINHYLCKETIPAILKQSYQDFEIIILPDRPSGEKFSAKGGPASGWPKTKIIPTSSVGPAQKRDIGAKYAQGEILAFLDDDSYPDKNWLKNAVSLFKASDSKSLNLYISKFLNFSSIAAVCGPTLTPPHDNLRQKASGYVWSSWLGSGGAGTYRCAISSRREIDDYPTVNFLVRKKDFLAVGGFNSHFWPGEDSKLCHDLVYKLGRKIIYDPKVLVYHHRREIFKPHLIQISRYAIHRGHFARILPKTSFRIGYLVPTVFVVGLVLGLLLSFVHSMFKFGYLGVLGIYGVVLLLTALGVYFKEKNLKLALLVIPSILATHLLYGILFVKGYLSPKLKR